MFLKFARIQFRENFVFGPTGKKTPSSYKPTPQRSAAFQPAYPSHWTVRAAICDKETLNGEVEILVPLYCYAPFLFNPACVLFSTLVISFLKILAFNIRFHTLFLSPTKLQVQAFNDSKPIKQLCIFWPSALFGIIK